MVISDPDVVIDFKAYSTSLVSDLQPGTVFCLASRQRTHQSPIQGSLEVATTGQNQRFEAQLKAQ